MKSKWIFLTVALFILNDAFGQNSEFIHSSEPPIIPVGEDAYLEWAKLPYHRIGVRAYMRSTYDRDGNNRSMDAGHFLYQESDSFNVLLDIRGQGILYFKRTNFFHGSPWHYEVDGDDFIVRETATADPVNANLKFDKAEFIPQDLFPNPLTWTWTTTKGADLMWVPLMFEKSFRLAYTRTYYGTGYFIYHLFPPGIKHISRPLQAWNKMPPDPKVLDLINRSGADIAPTGDGVYTINGKIELKPSEWTTVAYLDGAPAMIRALKFVIPKEDAFDFGKSRLRITWDNRWHASIDAPIALFFGAGDIHYDDGREYLVKGFPLVIRQDEKNVYLSCYWPMPFFKNAKIEIQERNGLHLKDIQWQIRTVPYTDPINHVAYFHASYYDNPTPRMGQDNILLDTDVAEGGGPWAGQFVGMSWIFTHRGKPHTLEGDPRFFFDDSKTPQAWGTGTEEWGGGGNYWGGENMTIPFAGHPVGSDAKKAKTDKDLVNSAYRFLIADHFPFGRRAVIGLEHGALNNSMEHYSAVSYWYGIDSPSLVLTDEVNVCNEKSMKVHEYLSPTAEEPYNLVSRYEKGPNTGNGGKNRFTSSLYFPAEEDRVRIMRGTTQFKVFLDPDNLGVMLRRKFDYSYPNQHARIYVKPSSETEWNDVGEWYTAGSNTCVFSKPRGRIFTEVELAPTEHHIITSNRRWREEEFLIPRHLTEDVEELDVKIEFIPNSIELFPGQKYPVESAWSEARYWVFCYKMPTLNLN
jgi:D-arabinan exo alpha-(1,3)/(1,5)-arabinofuranosidase (non-reducing end)